MDVSSVFCESAAGAAPKENPEDEDDVVLEAPNVPKENPDDVAVALFDAATCPGLGDSHAIHVVLSASLVIIHTSHVQDPAFFLNLANRSSAGAWS